MKYFYGGLMARSKVVVIETNGECSLHVIIIIMKGTIHDTIIITIDHE